MLDIIAAITLTGLAVLVPTVLLLASPLEARPRWQLASVVAAWFVGVTALGAFGFFAGDAGGVPLLGVVLVAPLVAGVVTFRRSATFRRLALTTPTSVLVGVHGGRLLGVFFLILLAQGRLPATFATAAGWGDIGVGAVALLFGWMLHRGTLRPRGVLLLLWNAIGFADLVIAVTLGVGSAPGSPVRFISEATDSGTIASLPWVLIPTFLVPLYLLTHLAIFAHAARETRPASAERSHLLSGAA